MATAETSKNGTMNMAGVAAGAVAIVRQPSVQMSEETFALVRGKPPGILSHTNADNKCMPMPTATDSETTKDQ